MLSRAIRGGKCFLTQKLPLKTAAFTAESSVAENWLRGRDLNPRPSGYEPDELPGCSTPRFQNSFDVDFAQIEKPTERELFLFAFAVTTISLICERKNSRRHSQLGGSRLCRALVSEKDAGWRAASVVCAAFRNGRGELDIL